MARYKIVKLDEINDKNIDEVYKELLNNKDNFYIIDILGKYYVLTKEKSIIEIDDVNKYIEDYNKNIFYRTVLLDEKLEIKEKDIQLYYNYIDKYKEKMTKQLYGDKYIFGSVAVRSGNHFITTLRGKKDLKEYTVVKEIDHKNHIVYVTGKKATLNAPLLDYLFRNKKVKVIVHINHEYDDALPYDYYAIPGTLKDTKRDFKNSFNIKNHGLFYLFDENGNLI